MHSIIHAHKQPHLCHACQEHTLEQSLIQPTRVEWPVEGMKGLRGVCEEHTGQHTATHHKLHISVVGKESSRLSDRFTLQTTCAKVA